MPTARSLDPLSLHSVVKMNVRISILLLHTFTVVCNGAAVMKSTDFLLLAASTNTGDQIYRVTDTTNQHQQLLIDAQKVIIGIDYDIANNCVLWSDNGALEIRRQCFKGTQAMQMEVLHRPHTGYFGHIAYDWVSQMVYFTNVTYSRIEAISTVLNAHHNQLHRTVAALQNDSNPLGIAVHPRRGYVFWTCHNTARIMRANLDGADSRILHRAPAISEPFALIVDYEMERVFWTDAGKQNIASCRFDGADFRVHLIDDSLKLHPYGMAMVDDTLFWTNPTVATYRQAMVKQRNGTTVDLLTAIDSPKVVIVQQNIDYWDVRFVSAAIQAETNACSWTERCEHEHACVGAPDDKFSCVGA